MIFCVEDDDGIRNLMIYALHTAGFETKGFSEGAGLFQALKNERPELILLDIMLPGDDGLTILKKLRIHPETEAIPVIMATAKGTEYDKVSGLDLGADDYLAKPFGMMEMLSRVKAVLRRTARQERGQAPKSLRVGEIEMNTAEHTVFVSGSRIELTLKEYELLYLFLSNLGKVFTRDQLLERIWDSAYTGETRTVDVHIGTLRTKLGASGDFIQTVRGVGYRMEDKT